MCSKFHACIFNSSEIISIFVWQCSKKNEVTGKRQNRACDLKIHSAGSLKMTSQHTVRAQIPTKCYAMLSTHIKGNFKEKKIENLIYRKQQ